MWIKDCNDFFININNYDFIKFSTIYDKKTNESVFDKFELEDKEGNKQLIGYLANEYSPSEVIRNLIIGVEYDFRDLQSMVSHYISETIEEKDCSLENFSKSYEDLQKYVQDQLFAGRFYEES